MYTTDPVVRSFNHGGRLQLNVNISSHHYSRPNISLVWYHNGARIVSGSKFTIIDNNTVLTITDMEPSDAGEYTVRISSIDASDQGYSNDPQCEAIVLPSLEFLALHAPVTFTVQQNFLPEYNPLSIATTYSLKENRHRIELSSEPSQSFYPERSYWSRNGIRLIDGAIYNSTVSGQSNSLMITFNDTDVAAGSYVGISWVDIYELHTSCRGYFYYLDDYYYIISRIPTSVSYWNVILQCKFLEYIRRQRSYEGNGASKKHGSYHPHARQ